MPTMITGRELLAAVKQETFIRSGHEDCAEGVKYDFRLGQRLLKAGMGAFNVGDLTQTERNSLVVDPGEVVFALTEERVVIGPDMVVQLSPKRKMSHAGILTIGGMYIDPGYEGRLLLGLFNISSTPFRLMPGKKMITGTFYRLVEQEVDEFPEPPPPFDDFPAGLVQVMDSYKPMAVQAISDAVKALERRVDGIQGQITSHQEWRTGFEKYLDEHSRLIGELTRDLQAEKEARRGGQTELAKAVSGLQTGLERIEARFSAFTSRLLKIGAWVGAVLTALLVAGLTKLFFG